MGTNELFPWERRLGKIGEAAIQKCLSYFSTTNKVDDDIGLDFYCELLENQPPHEFYVQAKGTQHFDEKWGAAIKKSTLVYWLWKPNPVYLIVFDEPHDVCYWMSIEDHRYEFFNRIFNTNSETVYFTIDQSHVLERGRDKNSALIEKIKEGKNSIELFRGRPTFKGDGYVKQIPDAPRNETELVLTRENVRQFLYSLIKYYLQRNDINTAISYLEFLTKFDPTGHYNHFFILGQLKLNLKEKDAAAEYFRQALSICKRDKNWPKESMEPLIKMIEEFIEKSEQ